ncbi:MAG: NAD-dependent histone deacetylase sir2 [Vezdaea acicularis]|nr:MAG: NAD-dependent histone deacetylase sir2 [Vezdaea acicularis]
MRRAHKDDDSNKLGLPLKRRRASMVDLTEDGSELDSSRSENLSGDDGYDGIISKALCESILKQMGDEQTYSGERNACTSLESAKYRQQLHDLGPKRFYASTVENGSISARRLLTAFGVINPPSFLEDRPDEEFKVLLQAALDRELKKRPKLVQYNTFDDFILLLKKAQKIIVLTGAGISTSLGIPDFRSTGDGLYDALSEKLAFYGLSDPQELFHSITFSERPEYQKIYYYFSWGANGLAFRIFYSAAKDILLPAKRHPFSPAHSFIRLLQDNGKLLTNYTQNIDGIELDAGLLPNNLVQCHGSLATVKCTSVSPPCDYQASISEVLNDIQAGRVPRCPACLYRINQAPKLQPLHRKLIARGKHDASSRTSNKVKKKKRRRVREDADGTWGVNSDSDDQANDIIPEASPLKPNITFFEDDLPEDYHHRLEKDIPIADLVIIMGTSLKVKPVSEIVQRLPKSVPQILISRHPAEHVNVDITLLGDCDRIVDYVSQSVGWTLEYPMLPRPGTESAVAPQLIPGYASRYRF